MEEGGIVGVDELAWDELVSSGISKVLLVTVKVAIAELHDHFVVLIEKGDHAVQVRNQHLSVAKVEVARLPHAFRDEADVLAVQREVLDASIGTIGDGEHGFMTAIIQPKTVGAVDLARFASAATEGANPVCVFVVLVDPARAVSVRNIETTVWGEGDVGGNEGSARLVHARLFWSALHPNDFTIERCFGDFAVRDIAVIDELLVALLSDVDAMSSTFELGAPRFDELAVLVVDDDGIIALARGVDGMGDVYVTLGILDDAVCVSVFDIVRRSQPVVNAFVLMATRAKDDRCH